MKQQSMLLVLTCSLVPALACGADLPRAKGAYQQTRSLPSVHATQAAAADDKAVYAVSSTTVAMYDRATGKELGTSTGPAQHLNSAFLHEGKVYCAHSNFPKKPHQSDIRVFDPATMKLTIFHAFEGPPGSLTWAVKRDNHWWCHFAHYGKDKARSVLLKLDEHWQEVGRWTFPPELVADWGNYSLSGGIWNGEELLATGHDKKVIYRLRLPKEGKVAELVDVIPSPFPGQGIAVDPKTGGLVGIDRDKKAVLFATFEAR